MKRALVVDDNVENLYYLSTALRTGGYSVDEAENGADALAQALANPPDFVVSDLMMPVLDGFRLLREWRAEPKLKTIPFIVYTATYTEPEDEKLALSLGADAFIVKPLEHEELIARIEQALVRRDAGALPEAAQPGDPAVLEEYSRALLRKLERRNLQLEAGNRALQQEIAERTHTERELKELNDTLERRVAERTRELESANRELESFTYSVSHDLRAPVRRISGFSAILENEFAGLLPAGARNYLHRIAENTQRMGELIDDLFTLSLVSRTRVGRSMVNLSEIANSVRAQLQSAAPERKVETVIQESLTAHCDPKLIRIALENLLGNAWKFTAKMALARIEFGAETDAHGERVFYVRDNGAGFDMEHAAHLFEPFRRMHSAAEFEGSGIGLATVQRIVARHDGRIWANAAPGAGATFYFTLEAPAKTPANAPPRQTK